jgi:hypothetical protein
LFIELSINERDNLITKFHRMGLFPLQQRLKELPQGVEHVRSLIRLALEELEHDNDEHLPTDIVIALDEILL